METAADREADVRVRAFVMCCGVLGATLGVGAAGGVALAAPAVTATSTTVGVSPATSHPYQAVTVTVTVTTASGVTPLGTVDVTRGAQTWCSGVVVDPASGTASCTRSGALTVGRGAVSASFTPAAGGAFGPSSASAPLTAVAWTPVVRATASATASGCTNAHSLRFVVQAPAAASAAVAGGLPEPTGTITGPDSSGIDATLTDGVAVVCTPVFSTTLTYTYSGDANYARARSSLAIKHPDNAPHGGSGAPTLEPTSTPGPGTATAATAAPALAATGPGAGVLPAATLGLGLLLVGGGVVLGARARRET